MGQPSWSERRAQQRGRIEQRKQQRLLEAEERGTTKKKQRSEAAAPRFLVANRRGVQAFDFSSIFLVGIDEWTDAEKLGWLLMLALGFKDAQLTPGGADQGIDVVSQRACCQVKHWVGKVGRGDLQRLSGASMGRIPIFLAQTYSTQASTWADTAHVALFIYDVSAAVRPLNQHAVALANGAPRSDGKYSAATELEMRRIRARHWFGVVRRGPHGIPDGPGVQRQIKKVERTMNAAFAPNRSIGQSRRSIDAFEAAVTALARAMQVELPE